MSLFELIIQEANEPYHIYTKYLTYHQRAAIGLRVSHITTTALSNQCHSPFPSPTKNLSNFTVLTVLIPPLPLFFSKSRMHALTHLQLSLYSTPFSPNRPKSSKSHLLSSTKIVSALLLDPSFSFCSFLPSRLSILTLTLPISYPYPTHIRIRIPIRIRRRRRRRRRKTNRH